MIEERYSNFKFQRGSDKHLTDRKSRVPEQNYRSRFTAALAIREFVCFLQQVGKCVKANTVSVKNPCIS